MAFYQREYEWLAYAGSIFAFLFAVFVFTLFLQRKKTKPTNLLLILTYAIAFLGIAPFVDFLTFTIVRLNPELNQTYDLTKLCTVISFSANAIANIFILKFVQITFYEKEPKKYLILTVLQIIVIPFMFISYLIKIDLIVPLILHVVVSLVIYQILGKNAFYLRRKIQGSEKEHEISRNSLLYIGLSGYVMIISIFLFVSHEILLLIPIREYLSVALGWVTASIAAFLIYIGYTTPEWIRNYWIKNIKKIDEEN